MISIKDHHNYMLKMNKKVSIIGESLLLKSAFESLNIDVVDTDFDHDILISLNQTIEDNEKYQKMCNTNDTILIVSYFNSNEVIVYFDTKKDNPKLEHTLKDLKYNYQSMYFRDAYIIDQITRYVTKKTINSYFNYPLPSTTEKDVKVNILGNNLVKDYLIEHLKKLNIEIIDKDYNVVCSVYDDNASRHGANTLAIQKQVEFIQGSVVRFNGDVQYLIPHKTGLYEDRVCEEIKEPKLCVIMNSPILAKDIVSWVKIKMSEFNINSEIDSFGECIQESLNLWYQLFYDPIETLLELHPKSDTYWNDKNVPILEDFDNENTLHVNFVDLILRVICKNYDIELKDYDITKFTRIKKYKDEIEQASLNFEPSNGFLTIMSNIRAKTFGIKSLSGSDVKMIFNEIIPKTLGTIYLVCSFIGFELLSDKHQNYQINDKLGPYSLSKVKNFEFNKSKKPFDTWDKLSFKGTLKMKRLIEKIDKELGLDETVEMILYHKTEGGDRCIYGMNESGDKKRLNKSLKRIIEKTEGDLSGRAIILDVLIGDYDLPLIECNFV